MAEIRLPHPKLEHSLQQQALSSIAHPPTPPPVRHQYQLSHQSHWHPAKEALLNKADKLDDLASEKRSAARLHALEFSIELLRLVSNSFLPLLYLRLKFCNFLAL